MFVQGSPVTLGDICPPFATSINAPVSCIVMRLWTSNKHLSKINLVTRPLPFLRNIINDMSKISIIVILFEIVFSIYYRKFSVTKIFMPRDDSYAK